MVKSTNYAPDVYRALSGILLVYKPPMMTGRELFMELRQKFSDSLNQLEQRPISTKLVIRGEVDANKSLVEVPNLADHPLVSGPRYLPWEIRMWTPSPKLRLRSSGLVPIVLGDSIKHYINILMRANLVNVYHVTGRFGYITDNFFSDGRILDKTTFKHIRSGRLDSVLARIESTQQDRLFETTSLPIHSQEAYELAKAWPSKPARMAKWPVIYRIRCIHFQLPYFKFEITVTNENEDFIAQITNDIGRMLKSGAFTESIRRVRFGPFDVNDSLTDREWDLQTVINHLSLYNEKHVELRETLKSYKKTMAVQVKHQPA